MTTKLMDKLKETLSGSRPQIPLARPESRSNSVSSPPELEAAQPTQPRVRFKGSPPQTTSTASSCTNHNVLDAAHSPPSVLAQHLGPPSIEHKYPQDSTWRRHSISARDQQF